MKVQNKGDIGNPYHDEKGRFTRATDDKIPFLDDEATKSSGYSKKEYLEGKNWQELSRVNVNGRIQNKQNEFIDTYFVTPILKKLFSKKIIETTPIQDVWEPADYNQKLDKAGVDLVGEVGFKKLYTIDLKCISGELGKPIDIKNPEFNIIMFRYDPNVQNDVEGWIFKNNLTKLVGFSAIDTPYNKEELFNLGEERSKLKNTNGASMFLTNKRYLSSYLTDNFGINKDDYYTKFQKIKFECMTFGYKDKVIPIKGKDGTELNMRVSQDKNTGGWVCELKITGQTLHEKCKAMKYIRFKKQV
ncbi:MAG: hypothetical protein K5765_06655 [Clostridia bacterium]|nr:hypothetical protein [Clostridia bacterium]